MRRAALILAGLLLLAADGWAASPRVYTCQDTNGPFSLLPACYPRRVGCTYVVIDAPTSTDCTAGGSTGTPASCTCDGTAWTDTVTWLGATGGGGGGGEANTGGNLGGGLANYSTKVGVQLRFNTFDSADFDLASNLISIDDTKWATDAQAQNASLLASGTVPTARLGSGTANSSSYLRGDQTWATLPADDDVPEAGDFGALALTGDVSSSGLTTTIGNDKVTSAMVAFNYAGSASEGGPATTATALAANGANCSAGNYPLGVDASGAVEGCTAAGGGSGTVTSVDMTVPSILAVSGNPITTSGTLAVTLANQSANRIFVGPTSGSAAAPTFRAAVTEDAPFEPLRAYRWQDEMIGTADTASSVLTWAVTSGTTSTTTDGEAGHPGIITMSTSSSATGNVRVISSGNAILLGGGAWTYYAVFRLPTLSDGTNTYSVRLGFLDSGTAESTDGVFIRYTNGTNSGKYQCVSRNNGSENAVDTTVAASAGTWEALKIVVNGAGSSADCTIRNTTVSTSSQIPTGAGRTTGFGAMILKSLGGTARTMDLDTIAVQWIATSSR